ncbi:unnamed protein product [Cylindrotheca closterium]|uniref:2-dehydropantoate 2-reductase n=1 Tax=Cylindrotheca closterium TaxID=2856 RepID=A0AAD2FQG6_9STRA|nr:unnamed protein product [Cylindrotheca closterium]
MAFREPIHILGAGSIGVCWAALIRSSRPTYPVTLLARNNNDNNNATTNEKKSNQNSGTRDISLKRLHPKPSVETLQVPQHVIGSKNHHKEDLLEHNGIHNLLVTTKSYQAKEAVESVLTYLEKETSKIIIMCNGALSVKEDLAKFEIPLVLATTTHGAYMENNKQDVVHAGVGKTYIENSMPQLAELWDSVGMRCESLPTHEMNVTLWQKLAANCVINPLTAIFRCNNGELLLEPSFPQLLHEIVDELVTVANLDSDSTAGGEPITKEALVAFVYEVIRDTEHNRSSMYQDIVLKQQKSEIDHLNGFVVKKGRAAGVECLTNEDIVGRIKDLETRNKNGH